MEALHISEIIEGMVLGMNLTLEEGTLQLSKGTILTKDHLNRLRASSVQTLWIDTEANLEEILRRRIHSVKLNRQVYAKGDFVCLQGDPSNEFYILLEGELEVILVDEQRLLQSPSRQGRESLITQYGNSIATISGRLVNFGEMGPLLGKERTATIRAKSRSVVQSIPATGDGFVQTILQNPELGFSMAVTIAKRLQDTINGIDKYDRILMELNAIITSVRNIYRNIAYRVRERQETSGEMMLRPVCAKMLEKSALLERSLTTAFFQPVGPGIRCNDPFQVAEEWQTAAITLPQGADLPLQDDEDDYLYLLLEGELTVVGQNQVVQVLKTPGDMLGVVQALSAIELNYRFLGENAFAVVVTQPSRLVRVPARQITKNPDTYSALVLHICRLLAEQLRSSHQYQTESLAHIEEHFNRFSFHADSYLNQLKDVLNFFYENQQWIPHCMNEILVIKETLEKMDADFIQLKDCVKIAFSNPFAMPSLRLGRNG